MSSSTTPKAKPTMPVSPNTTKGPYVPSTIAGTYLYEPSESYKASIQAAARPGTRSGHEHHRLYEPSEDYNEEIRRLRSPKHRRLSMETAASSLTTASQETSAFYLEALDHFPFDDESERYLMGRP